MTEGSFNSTAFETITNQASTSSQPDTDEEILGPTVLWIFITLRAVQGLLASLGNLVTLIAVYKFEYLWDNSACRLVASLALADFCGGLLPFSGNIARRLVSSVSLLNAQCYVRVILNLVFGYGNVYCTLLCRIDRYIFITRPLRYFTIVTPQRALRAILIVWFAIVLQISLILSLGPYPDAEFKCSVVKVMTKWAFYETFAQYAIITFCVIVPIYVVIGYTSWKLSKNEPHISNYPAVAQATQRKKLREKKMAKTIGLVLGTYLTCYTPLLLYDIITFSYPKPFSFGLVLVKRILYIVYNCQAILNPFIYSWKNAQFRHAYGKLLCKKCQVTPIH